MELATAAEMVTYIEKKFSGPIYTAKAVPALEFRAEPHRIGPDYLTFKLEYTDQFGNRRPEFDGPIRCYTNGVTSSV